MASLRQCRQPDRGISLLGNPDERDRPADPIDDPLGQPAPLVEDELEADPSPA